MYLKYKLNNKNNKKQIYLFSIYYASDQYSGPRISATSDVDVSSAGNRGAAESVRIHSLIRGFTCAKM